MLELFFIRLFLAYFGLRTPYVYILGVLFLMVNDMVKRGRDLPLAPFKRIIKKSGGARVSADAADALRDEVEDVARDIASRASRLSSHAGRKTVTAQDVKLAVKA